eukprot:8201835-Ditylum_brightwellii.AAC.1
MEEGKTTAKMMKEQGEQALESEGSHKTTVNFEWKLPRGCQNFNVRISLIKVMTKIIKIDPHAHLHSSVNGKIWQNTSAYPTGAEFIKASDVKQEIIGHNPTRVKLFATLISKLRLNTIKFDSTLYTYLNKHSLYIHPDQFMRNNTVVIREITNIYRKLIRHEDFITKISEKIARWPALPNNVTQQ